MIDRNALSRARSLRLKVRSESYAWLHGEAVEVNQVFNFANETRFKAATRSDTKRKLMGGFDPCNLTAGATEYFGKLVADTIQRVCTEYAGQCKGAKRLKLRWRASRGAKRSQGWVPTAGLDRLVVRQWVCGARADTHDRDVNAVRNILAGSGCGPRCAGTSLSPSHIPSSGHRKRRRETGTETAKAAA